MVKQTAYTFKNGRIRISVKPNEFFKVDVSREWFWSRVPEDASMGELILREGWMTIIFRVPKYEREPKDVIGWDLNIGSMDGFNPELGWVRVDLR